MLAPYSAYCTYCDAGEVRLLRGSLVSKQRSGAEPVLSWTQSFSASKIILERHGAKLKHWNKGQFGFDARFANISASFESIDIYEMPKLPQIFNEVRLLIDPATQATVSPRIFQDKTIKVQHERGHLFASGSFPEMDDLYKKCISNQKAYNGSSDVSLKNMSLNGLSAAGLGSARHCDSVNVEVDWIVMEYIKEKKATELKAIKERNSVFIEPSPKNLTLTSLNGSMVHAQFAREQFIRLYQKTATGLQNREYPSAPEIIAFCCSEFPELLIIPSKDQKQMQLIGSFISLDRFETYLKGSVQMYSLHQTLSKPTTYDTPHTQPVKQDKAKEQTQDDTCPICLEQIDRADSTVLPKCQHTFCKGCLKRAFDLKPACPICGEIYGSLTGTQPKNGTMTVSKDRSSLRGYEEYGTIAISYTIPSGRQGDEHPNPGTPYQGASRIAYLPDSPEGNHVLRLLQRAFDQRLTFTIGRSSTTGMNNLVTWNDIHHKTSRSGGPTNYGYPDPDYLKRVQDELKAKGIY
ncbi:hypothetical protein DNTS_018255 [Danionella cerebrum]|uniref:E3 ubiquitin-protein ligase n=1 Tax=Danionella cerebrum TaxID=2873325 RepID=A0A553QJD4_9TELE|nr:hypothetical protein DNTS_018255 [Danionella translucida]